jgi:YYY domain-containing protein
LECIVCGQEGTGKKFCGHCGGELIPPSCSDVIPIPHEETRELLTKLGSFFVSRENPWRGWISFASIFFVGSLLNFIPVKFGSALLALLCVLFCLISLASKFETKEMVFSTLLVLVAFSIIFGCEIIYMKDLFAGALYRMNTVFKFHYQAWILLSIALGPFLKWFFEFQWPQWVNWKKALWFVLAIFVLGGAGMYPILAFSARMNGTSAELATMDGTVFYEHSFPVDYQAAQWIRLNVKPRGGKVPVILEAWGDSYMTSIETSGGRIATLTGYPTLLGWAWHEVQWRGSSDKAVVRGRDENDTIQHREGDIDTLYTSFDVEQTRSLLRKYGVDYVYVGEVERQKYKAHPENLTKFSQFGSIVFQAGGSALYKINP